MQADRVAFLFQNFVGANKFSFLAAEDDDNNEEANNSGKESE